MVTLCVVTLTEGLLKVHQTWHLRRHVVQMSLKRSAHQQGICQIRDVDANYGKRVSAPQKIWVTEQPLQKQLQVHYML